MLHADALLVTEHTMVNADEDFIDGIERPTEMFGPIVLAAHMYNRAMTLVWDCFIVCGLKEYTVSAETEFNALHRIQKYMGIIIQSMNFLFHSAI